MCKMNILEIIFQYFFIAIFIFSLIFYALIVVSVKRALAQTQIPLPNFTKGIMISILVFLLGALIFVIFNKP